MDEFKMKTVIAIHTGYILIVLGALIWMLRSLVDSPKLDPQSIALIKFLVFNPAGYVVIFFGTLVLVGVIVLLILSGVDFSGGKRRWLG